MKLVTSGGKHETGDKRGKTCQPRGIEMIGFGHLADWQRRPYGYIALQHCPIKTLACPKRTQISVQLCLDFKESLSYQETTQLYSYSVRATSHLSTTKKDNT